MTAPVAPMEARCEHCLDTGSKSKDMGGDLDCTACDAPQQRIRLRRHLEGKLYENMAWESYLFAQRQAAPVEPQPSEPSLMNGYVLMPRSPNEEMLRPDGFTHRLSYNQYQAMLDVAQPAQQVEAVGQAPVGWCMVPTERYCTDAILEAAGHISCRQYEALLQAASAHYDECVADGRIKQQPPADCRKYCQLEADQAMLTPVPQLDTQQAGDVARDKAFRTLLENLARRVQKECDAARTKDKWWGFDQSLIDEAIASYKRGST